jgi:hypothetical protein
MTDMKYLHNGWSISSLFDDCGGCGGDDGGCGGVGIGIGGGCGGDDGGCGGVGIGIGGGVGGGCVRTLFFAIVKI